MLEKDYQSLLQKHKQHVIVFLGIVNGEDFQLVLSDTPGIIKPAYEMQESMMNFVKSAFEDADILIYMVEIGEQDLKDEAFFNKIIHAKIPVLLIVE